MLRAELYCNHRIWRRRFVARSFEKGGVGAELGVYTGMFSTQLLAIARPRLAYFVDVWWTVFGDRFPDWGQYTDFGRLGTRAAHAAAVKRIDRSAGGAETRVVIDDALAFLASLPDDHLDWVYVDTGHTYDENLAIVRALRPKLKRGGILAGDDWRKDPDHPHYGGTRALEELIAGGELQLIGEPRHGQWIGRLRT